MAMMTPNTKKKKCATFSYRKVGMFGTVNALFSPSRTINLRNGSSMISPTLLVCLTQKDNMPTVRDAYLVVYNVACASGWGFVLLACIRHLIVEGRNEPLELYLEVKQVLQVVQTAALLEVFHALLGVVRSPWMTTLMQVSSRIVVVWGFLWALPSTQAQIGCTLCLASWASVEIPRYLFYAFGVLGSSPYVLFYLRYSLFFVLYPTGITGELMTIWKGLSDLETQGSFNVGPVPFSLYWVAIAILLVYIPGGPYMYMNMVSNRRSAFKKRNAGVTKTKAA